MKRIFLVSIFLCVFVLSACGAVNVPSNINQHQMMNMKPASGKNTNSEWTTPKTINANQDVPITILIKDKYNKPIKKFETVNTKKMHLVVVSKDLSYFAHIHPVFKGNGIFEITTQFPSGGDYKLYAEMTPAGAPDYSIESHWIHVTGPAKAAVPLKPDSLTKVIDGKRVTLSFNGILKAKKNIDITFTMYDAKTNKPIKKLKPYLGAMGHATAIDKDVKQFMHIHPLYATGNGPDVVFMTYFPSKGMYKLWGQFNVDGHILTVPFIVNVG